MTEIPRQVDVLVAGAGPAGSATAALLARAGRSVLAVDRAAFPREKACAEYMSPEAVRILDRLGVVEALERAGASALEGMKVIAARGATAHGLFARTGHPLFRPTGLSVSRRILDCELVGAARRFGALVLERTALEELITVGGTVAGAVLRDYSGQRHAIHARLVVGADGLRSVVARRIGRRVHGTPSRMAFVAHVAGVPGMGASAELHFGRTSYVGLNQIGQDRTNVAVVVPRNETVAARGRVPRFFFERLAEFPSVLHRVEAGRIVRQVLATGPFAVRTRPVIAPGTLLVGDAADFFDPVTGDGIYSALRGAELVAEAVIPALARSGVVNGAALRHYRRLRRRAFLGKWFMERATRYLMHYPWVFDRSIRRMGRHEGMAHLAVGVAGGCVPLREILNPGFIARMVI